VAATEKRGDRRFLVEDCTVECRPHSAKSRLHQARDDHLPVLSLGMGGVQFLTEHPPDMGETMDLSLAMPDFEHPLRMWAIVRWAEGIPDSAYYRVGATFAELLPETRAVLKRLEGIFWPRRHELLGAGVQRLRLPAEIRDEVIERLRRSITSRSMARDSDAELTPGEPDEPDDVDEQVPSSPEAIDRLLSAAISRKRAQESEEEPEDEHDDVSTVAGGDDRILRANVLGDDPGGLDRTVSRYLEIFFPEAAECVAHQLSDDSMVSVRPPSFPRGAIVVFYRTRAPMPGDLALVEIDEGVYFRQVLVDDDNSVRLRPLNPAYPEIVIRKSHIKSMYRVAGKYDPL